MAATSLIVDRLTAGVPGFPAEFVANFRENVELAAAGGLSPATVRAIRSDVRRFAAWCSERGIRWLPADGRDVAIFLEEMGATGNNGLPYAAATLDRMAFSIRTIHQLAELPPPESVKIKLVRKAHARRVGRLQAQATGLTLDMLRPVIGQLDAEIADSQSAGHGPNGNEIRQAGLVATRDKALLLTGYCILARGSELLSLAWDDITEDGVGGAVATIRRSKVDQEGLGADQHLWPAVVEALRAWRLAHDAELIQRRLGEDERHRALWAERFRPPVHSCGRKRIHPIKAPVRLDWLDTPQVFRGLAAVTTTDGKHLGWPTGFALSSLNSMIAERARSAGLKGAFSSHSLRIGAAQDLVAAGKSLPAIMQDGRWKSPQMVLRYARKLLANRGAMAEMGRELTDEETA